MVANILIIEDDPVQLNLLSKIVKSVGHSAIAVSNGLDAFEMVKQQHFDLLLLDMYMPILNGWDFLELCKQQTALTAPVIIISTGPLKEDHFPNFPTIKKPYKPQQILSTIAQTLCE
jgi:CheY-like chemotaxis protein